VRLEEQQQPPRKGVEGAQGGGDLVGIVPEIVDHRDAAGLADFLEAAAQAFKAAQHFGGGGKGNADGSDRRDCRQRIRGIVVAGYLKVQRCAHLLILVNHCQ
jgi:hypothetical protein